MATVGTLSGPAGTVLDLIRRGAELWVRSANAKGGVAGHQVKLLVFDDGGDPAKHRSQVQEAVERHKAIGFLANAEVIAGAASVDYINAKRVPVVGTDGGEEWPYTSPMYFLPVATGSALLRTFVPPIAQQMLPKGKKRFGSLICVEAAGCNQADEIVAQSAKEVGLDQVYRGRSSLAQPDFTAECLAARNQKTEVLLVVLDQNSIDRLANACNRQGYKPTIALVGQVIADQQKKNPLLTGAVGSSSQFPYTQTGTPATDEFQSAMKLYGNGLPLTASLGIGWVAGKLLEKAAANISEPPTSASLLEGLWSIKNDTLGGIVPPLTFTRDQPPPPTPCWFNLVLSDRGWVTTDGHKLQCL
jgi:branched-chain amino acid transport system substrate-binding protein